MNLLIVFVGIFAISLITFLIVLLSSQSLMDEKTSPFEEKEE